MGIKFRRVFPISAQERRERSEVMKIHCPVCNREVTVPEVAAGSMLRCPECDTDFRSYADPGAGGQEELHDGLLNDVLGEVRQFAARQRPRVAAAPKRAAPPGKRVPIEPQRATPVRYEPAPSRVAWGQVIAVTSGLVLVLAAGYLAVSYLRVSIREQFARSTLMRAQIVTNSIAAVLKSANDSRSAKDYAKALEGYQTVVLRSRRILRDLKEADQNLRSGPSEERTSAVIAEVSAYLKSGVEGQDNPEVKFGAQGLVEYDGQWVSPERKKELFEAKMRAEGRQLYRGKWLTGQEIHEAKGEVLYHGRWIAKADMNKFIEAEKERTTPPVPIQPTRPTPPPRPATAFPESASQWVLDTFEDDSHGWSPAPWQSVNPCSLSIESGKATRRLRVTMGGGNFDKSAVVRRLQLDFKSRSRLVMDIFNNCREPVRIAIALETDTYYESRWKTLKTGSNNSFSFNLDTGDFKSAATHWAHATYLSHPESLKHLYILLYDYGRPGEVFIDNIVAVGGK